MNSDPQYDFPTIRLRPIISYPRRAQAGKSYLMTIDLQLEAPGAPWPFPEEEYAISCILDTQPFFSYEPLEGREPAIVLHRFGGSYGPAQYMLTAAPHKLPKGAISITFTNPYGIPIAYTELECEVSREAQPGQERAITIRRKKEGAAQEQAPQQPEEKPVFETEAIFTDALTATSDSKFTTTSINEESLTAEARSEMAEESPSIEQRAPVRADTRPDLIEAQLRQTGWLVQDYDELDLSARQGVAVRHYAPRYYDYLLFVDGELAGMVQVRLVGEPLAGSEEAVSLAALRLPTRRGIRTSTRSIVPCVYEATGYETRFTNYLEPEARSRSVFTFHRPETLALWLKQAPPDVPVTQNDMLRSRLRRMPPLSPEGLRPAQFEAITGLERSLAENRPRTLIQMPSNSRKTYMIFSEIYRLLQFGGVGRILYLTDTDKRAQYINEQFENYYRPLRSKKPQPHYRIYYNARHNIDLFAQVNILPIERLTDHFRNGDVILHTSSIIGQLPDKQRKALLAALANAPDSNVSPSLLEQVLEEADFPLRGSAHQPENEGNVQYSALIPIETFDIIFIDEADLHVTGDARPVLEYFDAFLVGLTEPGNDRALGFFGRNVVYAVHGEA
jgi:hypothetical protein